MKNIRLIILFLLVGLFMTACGSDRAGSSDNNASSGVLGVVEADRDNDGLSDGDEIVYGTNPDSNDTDGDGLLDGEEINIYDTNATNLDTDNDGLSDGAEVHTYDTNATNPDTDGDCLLDSFEILNYDTNATNADTDGDTVADGIEVYSYVANDLNISCLTTPETLEGGHNNNPAKDGIPTPESDVINALDPSNDSDGDGQANVFENNCTEGNASDSTKLCPYLTDTEEGNILKEHGYAYIPGGFDVDGDGINEGGFWMSRYQARSSGILIPSESVIETVGNINQYVSRNFKVLNRNIEVTAYNESYLSESNTLGGYHLLFDEESVAGVPRISGVTPYLALVELNQYILQDKNGKDIDVNVTLPTLKQYVHVQMLLEADLKHNGDGRHIRNGLLATDLNVPLTKYSLIIDEFGEEHREYLRNLVQLREPTTENIVTSFSINDLKSTAYSWWRLDLNKAVIPNAGASSSVAIAPYAAGLNADPYAVLVRGGKSMDFSYGITGVEGDTPTSNLGIGFRAVTDYLY